MPTITTKDGTQICYTAFAQRTKTKSTKTYWSLSNHEHDACCANTGTEASI